MEEKVNVWKANLTSGLIFALIGISFSLILYFLDLSLNKTVGYLNIPIQLILLYFLLKSYRDNFLHGQISYGQSVGAGVVIFFYYSIIMAVYTYILFAIIDPGLVAKQLAVAEEAMAKRGANQEAIDAGMAFTAKILKPAVMAPVSIFGNMFFGVIVSLLVSIFVKRDRNPLIDTPSNKAEY